LKLKSIEQAGRGFVSIAQMNRNLSIPSKLRVSVHLSDWKLRIEITRFRFRTNERLAEEWLIVEANYTTETKAGPKPRLRSLTIESRTT